MTHATANQRVICRVLIGMTLLWRVLAWGLSIFTGLVLGVGLMWLAVPSLKTEVVGDPTWITYLLARGYPLPVVGLVTALFSPNPVMHTLGFVVPAAGMLIWATPDYLPRSHFMILAAATLIGCAAARIGKNYALTGSAFSGSSD